MEGFVAGALPAVLVAWWGLKDGETGQPIWPGSVKFFPLAIYLFSISFLWVLGARVIGFKAKAKLSFPPNLSKTALGRPESCPGGMGTARTHAGLGKGGRSSHASPLAQFTSRVTVLFKVGPLYDPWSPGQRLLVPLSFSPPLETTKVKTVRRDDTIKITGLA